MKVDLRLMAISKYLIKIPQSSGHSDSLTCVFGISFHVTCELPIPLQMALFFKKKKLIVSKRADLRNRQRVLMYSQKKKKKKPEKAFSRARLTLTMKCTKANIPAARAPTITVKLQKRPVA